MKKIAILLSLFFIGFSQAQTSNDKKTQKKEHKKQLNSDPDARVFIIKEQKDNILTKEEALKNKKGYKRINAALNKKLKIEKRKERKSLRTQNRMFNKAIKQSKKRHKKRKKL